jgi:TRAP-type C4-dicarboxylate transport system permease large subunit
MGNQTGENQRMLVRTLLFVVMHLVLGAILDTFGMIILTLPFVFPIILELGYDSVWFGIFITVMIELALITPPIGLNVYVMHSVIPDIPVGAIFRGCLPFVFVTLAFVG